MQFQGREISPTQSAAVALRDEFNLIREGYEFLDEKSIQLAAEIMRQLEDYRRLQRRYRILHGRAKDALIQAIGRHGMDGLSVYPALDLTEARVLTGHSGVLGVKVVKANLAMERPPQADPPVNPSPEARLCAETFLAMVDIATELAGVTGNLHRLIREYQITEHRARALENVLLPEIKSALKEIEESLEAAEQEEAVLVRHAQSRQSGRGVTNENHGKTVP